MQVLQRGWLSSNNILFTGRDQCALVDSGYRAHAEQTVALVANALGGRALDLLVNTHLHSDHCGGNAALQRHFTGVRTLIPPGLADAVQTWDEAALSYASTGQDCERFAVQGLLLPGTEISLGGTVWQVHAAPGHDNDAVLLFEPATRVLISADALWENGFGVVFPELDLPGGSSEPGFAAVGRTLDLIEQLAPRTVVPGHGRVFSDVGRALDVARKRLEGFIANPAKHATHAAKVLLKFKLLELQRVPLSDFAAWAARARLIQGVHARYFGAQAFAPWVQALATDLVRSGAATLQDDWLVDA